MILTIWMVYFSFRFRSTPKTQAVFSILSDFEFLGIDFLGTWR
jgi:hypothetical protein